MKMLSQPVVQGGYTPLSLLTSGPVLRKNKTHPNPVVVCFVLYKDGYKGPRASTELIFADAELRGFWPSSGHYSTDGLIQPGIDDALDLGDYREFKEMGVIIFGQFLPWQLD